VSCYPLTLADQHTRSLLACRGLSCTSKCGVRSVPECAFRPFGLPRPTRTDNGVPFAACGIHALSAQRLWMRLGIQYQPLHPASPEENGARERMPKTLTAGACRALPSPPAACNRFRTLCDEERPHAALGGQTPSSRYPPVATPVSRAPMPPLEYHGRFLVKPIASTGTFRFKNKLLFTANAPKQHHIGLKETADGIRSTYFGTVLLAKIHERDMIIQD
jgi:putative transposase